MPTCYQSGERRFPLGALYTTAEASRTLPPEDITEALSRHARGDWGDLCQEDRDLNESALRDGNRLLSVYYAGNGVKFWIVTEADRRATTVLLPDDY